MGGLSVAYADSGIVVGSCGPIAITVLTEPSTLPRLAELRGSLEALRDRCPEGTFSLTVLARGSMVASVPAEIREESTAIARDFPSLGSTIVVEGDGFAAATIRAFLSGLFLISRNRSQIHRTVDEAAAWLAERIVDRGQGGAELSAPRIRAAVRDARAAIG